MSQAPESVDDILTKLAKDVELAVHAMYRREAGPGTTQVRTGHLIRDARARIEQTLTGQPAEPRPSAGVPDVPDRGSVRQPRFTAATVASTIVGVGGDAEWTSAEAAAVIRCVQAWLPVGSPNTTKPETKCIASGKELLPSWGERELARAAVRKIPVREG